MEQLKQQPEKDLSRHLPQSENEWLATKSFHVENVVLDGRSIRCAFSPGREGSQLVTMVGGIPRDPERRKNLPLINKLYGHLALKLSKVNESSVMYNQPATGGSLGDWNEETLATRTKVVEGISRHFSEKIKSNNVALIGTSAGAYMALRSVESLNKEDLFVKKVVLISPGFYPASAETLPYGETFKKIVSNPWDVRLSPFFSTLEDFLKKGGEVLITFFESDDPPIPLHMQEYARDFARSSREGGGKIEVFTIPRVGHNFRIIGSQEGKNTVDNQSIRDTASLVASFLSKEK